MLKSSRNKMKRTLLIVAFITVNFINGQDDPSSILSYSTSNTATPNAYSFIKYKESPVNYYSGKASLSIPIYTIEVGGLVYPISLDYTQGGVQVNSLASDVGLGWSLSSCFVNRTVVGDADLETINNSLTSYQMKYGFLDKPSGSLNNPKEVQYDFFPDIFKVYAPQFTTNFYFYNKTSVVELDKKGTKIDWNMASKNYNYLKSSYNGQWINNDKNIKDYENFNLISKNGISYSFQDKDITHSFTSSTVAFGTGEQFGRIKGSYPRVSAWHISKMKNLTNNEEINFVYETYSATKYTEDDITNGPNYRIDATYPTKHTPTNYLPFATGWANDSGKHYNRMLSVQRIKKIIFRGGSIEFNYGIDRQDLYNGKALTNILVKDGVGNIIKQFDMNYDYFYSTLQKNEFSKRLKLISVQESGQNKYKFDYYEDNKLPNIGSPLQDIFGYNNTNETIVETPTTYTPKYYFYPRKWESSILPYNLTSDTHYLLNGQIDKEPNELSKTWSLKKVTFPTGGTNIYVLESNTFDLWGNIVKGGGVRVKQQIIQDENSSRTIDYKYNKTANISSGYLFNVPYAGYPASTLYPTTTTVPPDLSNYTELEKYFFLYTNAKINYDLLNNFFVGYSKVEENENGKKSVYEYTNDEYPNIQTRTDYTYANIVAGVGFNPVGKFIIPNSAYGNDVYSDQSYKRGSLKYLSQYDQNNNLLLKKENTYKSYDNSGPISYPNNIEFIGSAIYSDPIGGGISELMQNKKVYSSIYNNLVHSKTTIYNTTGNIVQEAYSDYDDVQNTRTARNLIGNGIQNPEYNISYFYYPYHFPSDMQDLININKINKPVMTYNYKGELDAMGEEDPNNYPIQIVSRSKTIYKKDASSNNFVLPEKTQTAMADNPFIDGTTNDLYDDKGNLLQYTPKDGIPVTIIWGYNQTKPIAKIEGITYSQLANIMNFPNTNIGYKSLQIVINSDLDTNDNFENQTFIPSLNTFRLNSQLQNFKITTLAYDPLVGVKTIIPPSGIREFYVYDSKGRLKEVRENDINGNIIKEYNYNYKQ